MQVYVGRERKGGRGFAATLVPVVLHAPSLIPTFRETSMKQITALYLSKGEDENEDKVEQNAIQNEDFTLLHCTVEATGAATGRFWTDGRKRQPFVSYLHPSRRHIHSSLC